MDFPILDITDDALAEQWLRKYFHPKGLRCPNCSAGVRHARPFGQTRRSHVTQHRCRKCEKVYTVYSGTVLAHKHLRPTQVILLLRGICKGESSATLARELKLAYDTVHHLRQQIQSNALQLQPETPLPDAVTETDEMFQNAGKKGEKHSDPADPPRRRANKQKGHGTDANDRPPIVGTVGRESGQLRLRMVKHTDGKTLQRHIAQFTQPNARANTDEWQGYKQIERAHVTVNHGTHEWARDEDGDGIREVHIHTTEGMWTGVRNFLRPLRGVHKTRLSGYVAICEHRINRKRITPEFIAALVRCN